MLYYSERPAPDAHSGAARQIAHLQARVAAMER
jgi:hypothetical protein